MEASNASQKKASWLLAASVCVVALLPFGATGLAQIPAAVRDNDVTDKVENLGDN